MNKRTHLYTAYLCCRERRHAMCARVFVGRAPHAILPIRSGQNYTRLERFSLVARITFHFIPSNPLGNKNNYAFTITPHCRLLKADVASRLCLYTVQYSAKPVFPLPHPSHTHTYQHTNTCKFSSLIRSLASSNLTCIRSK